ncbi:hypothetical protein ACP4OV_007713 [Aristida adscensionis]
MARGSLQVALALVLALATAATLSSAQTTAQPAPFLTMPSCPPAAITLSPCIGYVFGVGAATLESCCSQFRSFFQAQAPCLCAAAKLAPSPVGMFLGQAQAMIPNVCNLPSSPCDDTATESTTPAVAGAPPPATAPSAAITPAADPSSMPAADPDSSEAATPEQGQSAPAGTGTKLPELPHAAGATSFRGTAAGTVFIAVLLASAAMIFVEP